MFGDELMVLKPVMQLGRPHRSASPEMLSIKMDLSRFPVSASSWAAKEFGTGTSSAAELLETVWVVVM